MYQLRQREIFPIIYLLQNFVDNGKQGTHLNAMHNLQDILSL